MLTKCPECELQVSDKASFCPHCGYPFKQISRPYASKRRKRLPNGFGQITELKRNLRKPFRVMITVGKDENGRPIQKLLKPEAYFATYNEAYSALLEYNRNPYELDSEITTGDLYEKWFASYNRSESRKYAIKAAWNYCKDIYNVPIRSLRPKHIVHCLENGTVIGKHKEIRHATESTRENIKAIFDALLRYAITYDLADHNYAQDVKISSIKESEEKTNKVEHKSFSNDEIKYLWSLDNPIAQIILIQCYTGFRPGELIQIETENVNIFNWSIVGGLKTEAGRNRVVPIHSCIREIVKKIYDMSLLRNEKYLFASVLQKVDYRTYAEAFMKLFPNHKPHDPRKHFITMAKKYKVDEYAIKRIVGHRISDITEGIYTDRDLTWMNEEISKIMVYE